jgi:hypothetical protein
VSLVAGAPIEEPPAVIEEEAITICRAIAAGKVLISLSRQDFCLFLSWQVVAAGFWYVFLPRQKDARVCLDWV